PGPRRHAAISGLAASARDGDLARAHHLDQPERADHALEGLDLLGRAGDLQDDRALRDVDDLPAEDLADLHDLRALRPVDGDLEERELAGDLVDRVQRPIDGERDPRETVLVRGTDREGVDVEPAPREQAGDAGQDARLVL